jgi:hypothetical protein
VRRGVTKTRLPHPGHLFTSLIPLGIVKCFWISGVAIARSPLARETPKHTLDLKILTSILTLANYQYFVNWKKQVNY